MDLCSLAAMGVTVMFPCSHRIVESWAEALLATKETHDSILPIAH